MSIPANAENARVAHEFIDFLLARSVLELRVLDGVHASASFDRRGHADRSGRRATLPKAIVPEDMMQQGYQLAELDPEVDQMWQNAWHQIKAGG
jgi:spermidine/putrescine-binding protein